MNLLLFNNNTYYISITKQREMCFKVISDVYAKVVLLLIFGL